MRLFLNGGGDEEKRFMQEYVQNTDPEKHIDTSWGKCIIF